MKCFTAYLILSSSLFFNSNGFFFSSEAKWDALKITYGPLGRIPIPAWIPIPGVSVKQPFANMPVTTAAAKKMGFESLNEQCSGDFQGYRYSQEKNPAVILLYDATGHIAGIQTSYAANQMTTDKIKNWFKQHPMFTVEKTDEGNFYIATAYFMNPDDICNKERALERAEQREIGVNLYLKNGTTNVLVSKEQSGLSGTKWTKGLCFPAMGYHYWYDISEDMNCDYIQPFFLLYWKGQLNGFGFTVFGTFDSTRFEHPPFGLFKFFMKPVPDCMSGQAVSTMHVYFNAACDKICLPL